MVDDVTGHDYTDDLSGKCFCSRRSDERRLTSRIGHSVYLPGIHFSILYASRVCNARSGFGSDEECRARSR
ncbi:hypothetical protein D3C76_1534780 [compost metagenome]